MRLKTAISVLALSAFGLAPTAVRAADINQCSPENMRLLQELDACRPKPPPVKKKSVAKLRPPPVPPKCEKGERGAAGPPGEVGPPGPQGIPGPPGRDCVDRPAAEHGTDSPRVNLGLGVMGSAILPAHRYAWAWGPALQLRAEIAERTELTVDLGLALGADSASWSLGQERAVMGRLGLTHYLKDVPWLGFTGGAYVESLGLKDGHDQGIYLGVTPGIVFRLVTKYVIWRTEIGPFLGGGTYGTDWQFVWGVTGSTFLMWNW